MRSIRLVCTLLFPILILWGCAGTSVSTKGATASNRTTGSNPQLQKRFDAAVSLMKHEQFDKARLNLQALIDQHPRLPGPHINMGIIALNEDNPAEAEASFTTAIELKPDSLPAHNQLGVALRMQGKFQQAEQTYRKALQLAPDYQPAHRNIGILYDLYMDRPEQALQHYKRCQVLGGTEDKQIQGWILDLERRIKSSK